MKNSYYYSVNRKMTSHISVGGLVLPNRPLTNLEINDVAKKLKIPEFRGVYVRDRLPDKPRKNECAVLNLDDSAGGGTHWVAWYRNNSKNWYFDSYGLQPPIELRRYLKDPVFYNTESLQPKGEVFCGHLCLYVLKQLSSGRGLQEVVNELH